MQEPLRASLSVVELTVAIHYVFRSPVDKILWDAEEHVSYIPNLQSFWSISSIVLLHILLVGYFESWAVGVVLDMFEHLFDIKYRG